MTVHDAPSAQQLVESVREFLESDVMVATTGRVNFHARVAINVLKMVERELADGASHDASHTARLGVLGCETDAQLAQAIRNGEFDDRWAEVVASVKLSVADKLRVANPKYFAEA